MSFRIERNNITKVSCDAIVNTANPLPRVGRGTDETIYNAAGYNDLLSLRHEIGIIERGRAVWTPSLNLEKQGIKFIIHTVGVPYGGGKGGQVEILRSCYFNSLNLAKELGCKSIAIPLLATGNYHFPKELALDVAVEEISRFLLENEMEVVLVVYDKESYRISEKHFNDIENFLDDFLDNSAYIKSSGHLITARCLDMNRSNFFEPEECTIAPVYGNIIRENVKEEILEPDTENNPEYCEIIEPIDVDAFISDSIEELNFQNMLQKKIADRNLSNAEVYSKALMDRKFFSKIINTKDYVPKKHTVMALGLALELPYDEFVMFLASAGYAIMPSSKFDLIIKYCVIKHIYNLVKVDILLNDHGLECFALE